MAVYLIVSFIFFIEMPKNLTIQVPATYQIVHTYQTPNKYPQIIIVFNISTVLQELSKIICLL